MAPRPSATLGAGGLATPAQAAPGAAGRASATQIPAEQQLAYLLTPQQQQELFDRRQAAEGAITEAGIGSTEAQGQFDRAMAALNYQKAQQASATTDEMIARGLLSSGTARGALADVALAAANQASSLEAALLATQQRNLAVTSQATEALGRLPGYAQGQAAENIAENRRQGITQQERPPGGIPPTAAQPAQQSAAQAPSVFGRPHGWRPFQPSWLQPPAMQAAKKRKKAQTPGAPGPGGPSGRV